MNKYRYAALVIGSVFSIIFVLDAAGDIGSFRHTAPLEFVILGCGPVSMIAATLLGWFAQARVAGWWLVAGGALTSILFTARFVPRIIESPANNLAKLCIVLAVFTLPMLVCGALLLKYAALRSSVDKFRNFKRLILNSPKEI
jgi:lipid-A-disaccharide synthase-like uncharacterized protein